MDLSLTSSLNDFLNKKEKENTQTFFFLLQEILRIIPHKVKATSLIEPL